MSLRGDERGVWGVLKTREQLVGSVRVVRGIDAIRGKLSSEKMPGTRDTLDDGAGRSKGDGSVSNETGVSVGVVGGLAMD